VKTYQTFTFESCELEAEEGGVALRYRLDDELRFEETLGIPLGNEPWKTGEEVTAALRTLHVIGGASYWKTSCPKTIAIEGDGLTGAQAEFWNTVYTKGMGEFFYQNQINFRGLVQFPATAKQTAPVAAGSPAGKRVLLPIGGGKDSLVTVELLKGAGFDVTLLRIGSHPAIQELAKIADLPLLTVERHLDGKLFDLNAQGARNGHVPITAYNHALAVLVALLHGFDAVVFSNERSASVGSVTFHGQEVNHQWSKSLEFERMFQEYLRDTVTKKVACFSLLRPWSEVRIMREFIKYPQYLPAATSCNTNWRVIKQRPAERWCRVCPKCAFAFALYAAFLPADQVITLFRGNLFDDENLLPTFRELLGIEGIKPFECVGTPEETQAAFLLAQRRGDLEKSAAMRMFEREALPSIKDADALLASVLAPDEKHMVPAPFSALVS
jgi:hypothetical protein